MPNRAWFHALLSGTAIGLAAAAWMTIHDWRLNPAGLFHGAAGTNWGVVFETAVSWFLPVTALAVPLLAAGLWLVARLRDRGTSR